MKRAGRFLAVLAVLAFTAASPVLAEEAPAAGAAAVERLTAADAAAADAAAAEVAEAEVAEAEAGRGKRATGRRVRGAGR